MAHGYRPVISKIRCWNPNKASSKVRNYNSLRYIATREGVDLTRIKEIKTIDDMVNENLDLDEAGEEIAFQEAGNDKYLKYITNRPRSHGLFGNIDTENLSDVTKLLTQMSEKKKNIYRGIISLSPLDAQVLGYNNIQKWNTYLKAVMPDIASELGLSPNDITWVAAFHAEESHPHVHYMLWDNRDVVQSSFIHVSVQNKCREICQNAMFSEEDEKIIRKITVAERQEFYTLQNSSKEEIIKYFKDIFTNSESVPGVMKERLPGKLSVEEHEQLEELYKEILKTLPGHGRRAYQFMPVECKAYIDRVTDIFLNRVDIGKEYAQYLEAVENIHKMLGKTKKEIHQVKKEAIKELYNRTGNIVLGHIIEIEKDLKVDKKEEVIFPEEIEEQEWSKERKENIAVENNNYENEKEVIGNFDLVNFKPYSYALLKNIFSSIGQFKEKHIQKLNEAEFRTDSKQSRKEFYLHKN